MTEQAQVRALLELDGWEHYDTNGNDVKWWRKGLEICSDKTLPDFLHSYDAIIPVIQKLNKPECMVLFDGDPIQEGSMIIPTPSQLCEALLRAAGKWTE